MTELKRYDRPKAVQMRFRCCNAKSSSAAAMPDAAMLKRFRCCNAIHERYIPITSRRLISRSSSKVSSKVSNTKSVVQSVVIRAILPYMGSSTVSSKVRNTKSVVKSVVKPVAIRAMLPRRRLVGRSRCLRSESFCLSTLPPLRFLLVCPCNTSAYVSIRLHSTTTAFFASLPLHSRGVFVFVCVCVCVCPISIKNAGMIIAESICSYGCASSNVCLICFQELAVVLDYFCVCVHVTRNKWRHSIQTSRANPDTRPRRSPLNTRPHRHSLGTGGISLLL